MTKRQITDSPAAVLDAAPFTPPDPMLASALDIDKSKPFRPQIERHVAQCANPLWRLEEKIDGERIIFRKVGSDIQAWSRPRANKEGGGKKAAARKALTPQLVDAIRCLPDCIGDGELWVPGGTSSDVRRLDKKDHRILVLFDVLNVMGQDVTHEPYLHRRAMVEELGKIYDASRPDENATRDQAIGLPRLVVLPSVAVSMDAVNGIWAREGEGAILKRVTSRYEHKRSKAWIKVVQKRTAVLRIIGFAAGKLGPYSKLVLRDSDGIETSVKTKDDATRADIARRPDWYLTQRLVITYREKTEDDSYRHPMADHIAGEDE